MDRRQLLAQLGRGYPVSPCRSRRRAQSLRKKVKITDVKVMIVRGPTWDWNLIKIETDAGVHGIGEAYWGPGVKDMILKRLKDDLIGEDPLNVVKLYTKCLLLNGGYGAIAGLTVQAASGIEIALWDLAGKLICRRRCAICWAGVSATRFASTARCRRRPTRIRPIPYPGASQADEALANNPFGFTAFKFQGDSVPTTADPIQGAGP